MNVLAVDTSTNVLHIALLYGEYIDVRMESSGGHHSEELLSRIESIMKDHSVSFSDLDLLVATRGPGSFTSLRIGFSTLKGISLSRDIPLVSVPTLRLIAEACPSFGQTVVSVMDAKKKRYYLGAYRDGNTLCEIDGNAEDLLKYLEGCDSVLLTGTDANMFSSGLSALLPPSVRINLDPQCYRPLGGVLIQMGIEQLQLQGPDDIGQGPVYIRRSDAEEALLKKLREE